MDLKARPEKVFFFFLMEKVYLSIIFRIFMFQMESAGNEVHL